MRNIRNRPNAAAIASMLIALAERMGLLAAAECVETHEQQEVLIRRGCALFRGYGFGHPMPAEDLLATFSDRKVCAGPEVDCGPICPHATSRLFQGVPH